jgi:hypothetical protein
MLMISAALLLSYGAKTTVIETWLALAVVVQRVGEGG